MHKTCWYTTIHPLRVGAMVGSRGTVELAPLVRFGFHFGAAFQIRDDMLNLVGDEHTYGKEILGDIYEGKRTLPLVHLPPIQWGGPELVRDYLRSSREARTPELVRTVRELMDEYGSIEFTSEYAEGILLVAENYFEQAFAGASTVRTSTSFACWCLTSGRGGADTRSNLFVYSAKSFDARRIIMIGEGGFCGQRPPRIRGWIFSGLCGVRTRTANSCALLRRVRVGRGAIVSRGAQTGHGALLRRRRFDGARRRIGR